MENSEQHRQAMTPTPNTDQRVNPERIINLEENCNDRRQN
jgi:hypothetical protein